MTRGRWDEEAVSTLKSLISTDFFKGQLKHTKALHRTEQPTSAQAHTLSQKHTHRQRLQLNLCIRPSAYNPAPPNFLFWQKKKKRVRVFVTSSPPQSVFYASDCDDSLVFTVQWSEHTSSKKVCLSGFVWPGLSPAQRSWFRAALLASSICVCVYMPVDVQWQIFQ